MVHAAKFERAGELDLPLQQEVGLAAGAPEQFQLFIRALGVLEGRFDLVFIRRLFHHLLPGERVGEGAGGGEVVLADGGGPEGGELVVGGAPDAVVQVGNRVRVVHERLQLLGRECLRPLGDEAMADLIQIAA